MEALVGVEKSNNLNDLGVEKDLCIEVGEGVVEGV